MAPELTYLYAVYTEGSFSNGLFPTIARAQSFNLVLGCCIQRFDYALQAINFL